jgi:hypothetical protein
VLQSIADRRASGESFRAIADALNASAVPTARGGAQWHPATVRSVLNSRRGQVALTRAAGADSAGADLGHLIRSARAYRGLTASHVCANVGIGKPTLRLVENDRPTNAAPPVLAAIARTVGLSAAEVGAAIEDPDLRSAVLRWVGDDEAGLAHAA